VGRNGMHRYNNQDHSMLTAVLAVQNLYGGNHDLWSVNTERSYHENFTREEWASRQQEAKEMELMMREATHIANQDASNQDSYPQEMLVGASQ
jgi:hypothetical protein